MVSGRGREVQVLSSATAVVFLAQQPSDVAESWSSSCLDSCPSPTLGQNTGSAEHVGNAPLAGWQQVWVLGHREGSLLPYFSCNHRELEIHCVGATPAENLPTQAACGADVPAVVLFQKFGVCDFQFMLIIWPSPEQEERFGFFFAAVVVFLFLPSEYCDMIAWIIRVSYSVLQIVV